MFRNSKRATQRECLNFVNSRVGLGFRVVALLLSLRKKRGSWRTRVEPPTVELRPEPEFERRRRDGENDGDEKEKERLRRFCRVLIFVFSSLFDFFFRFFNAF